ncbi:MAG: SGNH/GDSL hydrolase family protein [Candidatus Omnitrophota bacterium]
MKKKYKTPLSILLLIVILSAALEGVFVLVLNNPYPLLRYAPRSVVFFFSSLYMRNVNIIQFMPECARYDSGVMYTLRPGRFIFSNIEFRTEYLVNSLGVRDDEASLGSPVIVVAGDSIAMGWGVEQDETFPQIIERKTGLPVLNAAVSSYGTVREMLLLKRVDRSRLKYLIIEYDTNDYNENREFYLNKNMLPVTGPGRYDRLVRKEGNRRRYFFGKHLLSKYNGIIRKIKDMASSRKDGNGASSYRGSAAFFLNAVINSGIDLTGVRVIVVKFGKDDDFVPALKKKKGSDGRPRFIREMAVLDAKDILSGDDYYMLDGHMNRRGHEKVAAALLAVVDFKK